MNYENIKSVLLTLSVIMSLVLTWSIWTYQPNYGVIEKTKFIQDVNIGLKKEPTSLILPQKILFHKNDHHYGTANGTDMKNMMRNIRAWNFNDFRDITASIRDEYLDFLYEQEGVEVIFPSEIPIETLKGILKIEDDEIRSVTFDRLLIPAMQSQQENSVAYFISYKNNQVYEAKLNNFSYQDFNREIFQTAPRYPQYFAYKTDIYHSFFLPVDMVKADRITYYSVKLAGKDFKNALFTDPSYVKQDFQESGGESYSDGSRALKIDSSGDYMRYINPSTDSDQQVISASKMIQKSVDFVNDHSGWTDTYQFTEWDSSSKSAVFRLHINGLPVYNYSGLSRMILTWGETGLFDIYKRPLFRLQVTIESESSVVELPSGQTLIDLLRQTPSFDPLKLEDVKIGYEMIKDHSNAKVTVEPIWIVKLDGDWKKIVMDDDLRELGGNLIGLE
ncbi:YycH family regulatory protein [Bacillus sp. DJP31]|uniref:YycH family regulatory protein n=1 Tax=Bacillus sp. DJP31 TaxID=3409789 RepID=UPI003BB63DA2